MKISTAFLHRLTWLNLPGAFLVALLQRTPVLRVAATAEEMVTASPLGAVLRSAVGTIASLGAVHALAGATTVITNGANPLRATVGTAISQVVFAATGAGVGTPESWQVSGQVPPGLTFAGLSAPGFINTTNPILRGTPTTAGTFALQLQAWEGPNRTKNSTPVFTYTVIVAAAANVAPAITLQPAGLTVNAGTSATFTVGVSGVPAPTYQWSRNGIAIAGATGSVLTLGSAQPADAGDYTVVATNVAGSVTSRAATLAVVSTTTAPAITRQPTAQTVASGGTVVFQASARGVPAPTFQWQRNGAPIAGATAATLVLSGSTALAGDYAVVATNSAGSVTSSPAKLTVAAGENFGRLINLSILTTLEGGDSNFTMGFVVGGAGTSGNEPLLVRAAGPSLEQLGVTNANPDPKFDLFSGATRTGQNDNWAGAQALISAFSQVGAFSYVSVNSRDAAMFSTLPAGDNSVVVSGVGGAKGTVIAELYDATAPGAATVTAPRLVNVSVRKVIEAGSTLTAGFVIDGTASRTVLVRAIGPGLTPFGVTGVMADPQLKLFDRNAATIAENDNWGGDAQLSAAARAVGAFALSDPASADAVLLITLPPGNYTAQVSGVGGSAGSALVEVYEVP